MPKPYVNPTRNGGVQFEWEAGERYFELEVVAEHAATYYWRDHSKADQKEGTIFEGDPLDTVLEYVSARGSLTAPPSNAARNGGVRTVDSR